MAVVHLVAVVIAVAGDRGTAREGQFSAQDASAFVRAIDQLGRSAAGPRRPGDSRSGVAEYQVACKVMRGCPGTCQYSSFPWGDVDCTLSPAQKRLFAEVRKKHSGSDDEIAVAYVRSYISATVKVVRTAPPRARTRLVGLRPRQSRARASSGTGRPRDHRRAYPGARRGRVQGRGPGSDQGCGRSAVQRARTLFRTLRRWPQGHDLRRSAIRTCLSRSGEYRRDRRSRDPQAGRL